MTSTTQRPTTELDRASFTESVQRYRRELHVHCYRMLGSFAESEDLVQETFLRAWRRRGDVRGPLFAPQLALQDRDERVSRRARQAPPHGVRNR